MIKGVRSSYFLFITILFNYIFILLFLLIDYILLIIKKKIINRKMERTDFVNLNSEVELNDFKESRLRLFDDETKVSKKNLSSKIFIRVSNRIWIVCFILISLLPSMFIFDQLYKVMSLLVPTFGYIYANLDHFLALIVSFFVSFVFLLFLPIFHKASNFGKVILFLIGLYIPFFLISLMVHPYTSASPKRIIAFHHYNTVYSSSKLLKNHLSSIRNDLSKRIFKNDQFNIKSNFTTSLYSLDGIGISNVVERYKEKVKLTNIFYTNNGKKINHK
jgi:hypothetical protein